MVCTINMYPGENLWIKYYAFPRILIWKTFQHTSVIPDHFMNAKFFFIITTWYFLLFVKLTCAIKSSYFYLVYFSKQKDLKLLGSILLYDSNSKVPNKCLEMLINSWILSPCEFVRTSCQGWPTQLKDKFQLMVIRHSFFSI